MTLDLTDGLLPSYNGRGGNFLFNVITSFLTNHVSGSRPKSQPATTISVEKPEEPKPSSSKETQTLAPHAVSPLLPTPRHRTTVIVKASRPYASNSVSDDPIDVYYMDLSLIHI